MDLMGKKVLVLGGFGLVGMAICRKLAEQKVAHIVVTSLLEEQAKQACEVLKDEYPNVEFTPEWGDLFVRNDFKDIPRKEIIGDPEKRLVFIHDILDSFDQGLVEKMSLYQQIVKNQPNIVIDCINTATGIAYQDVYDWSAKVLSALEPARKNDPSREDLDRMVLRTEELIASMNAPQLVRHIQVMHRSLIDGGCRGYLKVGTTGTGGMGLNIPYTHSEDRPSRVLLTKNAMGGAQSLMLFLMGRTPLQQEDGSIREIFVKEIKPAAAIAWKGVVAGEIRKKGQNFPRFDMDTSSAATLGDKIQTLEENGSWEKKDDVLKSVYIDTGENGIFSEGEFTAITEVGQMEFVTPEEIAQHAIWELSGGNSGHDVIGALDASVMEPTYRAGVLRQVALDKLREISQRSKEDGKELDESIAFELLGPPRLTKLLHEANLIRRTMGTMRAAVALSAEELAEAMESEIANNFKLRSAILSVGVPILLTDGEKYLRAQKILIPQDSVENDFEVTPEKLDNWCESGWVDLRPKNIEIWQNWFNQLIQQKDERHAKKVAGNFDTSSRFDFDEDYFDPDGEINPGKMAGWIFINVDKGKRTKR